MHFGPRYHLRLLSGTKLPNQLQNCRSHQLFVSPLSLTLLIVLLASSQQHLALTPSLSSKRFPNSYFLLPTKTAFFSQFHIGGKIVKCSIHSRTYASIPLSITHSATRVEVILKADSSMSGFFLPVII